MMMMVDMRNTVVKTPLKSFYGGGRVETLIFLIVSLYLYLYLVYWVNPINLNNDMFLRYKNEN